MKARLFGFRRKFLNKPFPSSLEPLFQSESKCEVFEMKMSFHSYGKCNEIPRT